MKNNVLQYGIDISRYNDIDWDTMFESDKKPDFIMIKAGGADDGKYTDANFYFNCRKAEENGIPYGVYYVINTSALFITDVIANSVEEAEHFKSLLQSVHPKYPVVCDVELGGRIKFIKNMLNYKVFLFCKMIEMSGYYTMIYTSASAFREILNLKAMENFGWWVGAWTDRDEDAINFLEEKPNNAQIWQYSSKGRRDFCKGDLDLDCCYVDLQGIIRKNKLNNLS